MTVTRVRIMSQEPGPAAMPLGPPPPSSVRPAVVSAMRRQVGTGSYRPPADRVAERLLTLLLHAGA